MVVGSTWSRSAYENACFPSKRKCFPPLFANKKGFYVPEKQLKLPFLQYGVHFPNFPKSLPRDKDKWRFPDQRLSSRLSERGTRLPTDWSWHAKSRPKHRRSGGPAVLPLRRPRILLHRHTRNWYMALQGGDSLTAPVAPYSGQPIAIDLNLTCLFFDVYVRAHIGHLWPAFITHVDRH